MGSYCNIWAIPLYCLGNILRITWVVVSLSWHFFKIDLYSCNTLAIIPECPGQLFSNE